jgi:hypothetical protein
LRHNRGTTNDWIAAFSTAGTLSICNRFIDLRHLILSATEVMALLYLSD